MLRDLFTEEDEITILEIARRALADAEIFDEIAGELDISDHELKKLQKRIEKETEEYDR